MSSENIYPWAGIWDYGGDAQNMLTKNNPDSCSSQWEESIINKKIRWPLLLIHLLFPSMDSCPSQYALLGLGWLSSWSGDNVFFYGFRNRNTGCAINLIRFWIDAFTFSLRWARSFILWRKMRIWLVYCENIGHLKRQTVFKLKMVSRVLKKQEGCLELQEEHISGWELYPSSREPRQVT